MAENDRNKLFVGGISRETTGDTLRAHFVKYGPVVASVVARDRDTDNPRGFGFVTFDDFSAVDKALQDTHVILERTVEVKKAIPRSEHHQNQQQNRWSCRNNGGSCRSTDAFSTKKIFVGGLAPSLTEREFRDYFEKFGAITDLVMMHDNATNRPRGFGFVTFDSEEAVEDVTKKSFHELTGKLVEVKRAVPKGNSGHSHNGCNATMGSGRENFNNYQHGNYRPYSPQCGILPSHGPFSGYDGSVGYPYGANFFGGGFLFDGYGGIGYGMTPLAPLSPWIKGGLLPYCNFPTAYPAYLNGGVGVMGMGINGYNGNGRMEVNGQLSKVVSRCTVQVNSLDIGGSDADDAQVAKDVTTSGVSVNVKSLDVGRSDGDTVNVEYLDMGGSKSDEGDAKVAAVVSMNGESVNVKSLNMGGSDGDTVSMKSLDMGRSGGQTLNVESFDMCGSDGETVNVESLDMGGSYGYTVNVKSLDMNGRDGDSVNVSSLDMDGSNGDNFSNENEEGTDGQIGSC